MDKLVIQLSQSQLRDAAMIRTGLNPKVMAMKPGTRRERDRKAAAKRGHVKHKSRLFD